MKSLLYCYKYNIERILKRSERYFDKGKIYSK